MREVAVVTASVYADGCDADLPSRPTISVIVCAYNEAAYLPACLHSLLAQTRPPDEIIVIDNASTDRHRRTGASDPGRARRATSRARGWWSLAKPGGVAARGEMLAYVDADCRAPLPWLERVERRFARTPALVAVTGPYRFYDWDRTGRVLIRAYDLLVAPPTHLARAPRLRRRRDPLRRQLRGRARTRSSGSAASTARIEFHGEDTNLGRRLTPVGQIDGRARVLGLDVGAPLPRDGQTATVFGLYVRNFWSEILRHRPADRNTWT